MQQRSPGVRGARDETPSKFVTFVVLLLNSDFWSPSWSNRSRLYVLLPPRLRRRGQSRGALLARITLCFESHSTCGVARGRLKVGDVLSRGG